MGRSEGQDVLQRPISIGLITITAWLSVGCSCMPPEVPVGLDLSSPRQTTSYLKWAFKNEKPGHVFNCLSTGLLERENLSQSDIEAFWGDVEQWFAKNIGDVGAIRVEKTETVDSGVKIVHFRTKTHRATARFVLECTWEVVPSGRDDASDGTAASITKLATVDPRTGSLTLTLPLGDKPVSAKGIYLIRVENFWKLDELIDSDLPQPTNAAASLKDRE